IACWCDWGKLSVVWACSPTPQRVGGPARRPAARRPGREHGSPGTRRAPVLAPPQPRGAVVLPPRPVARPHPPRPDLPGTGRLAGRLTITTTPRATRLHGVGH